MMLLSEAGQTYRFGNRIFTVGGVAIDIRGNFPTVVDTILAIHVKKGAAPTALCEFKECGVKCLPLADLMPASPSVPAEKGRLYALSYLIDGSESKQAEVLAVSSDKCVLVRKMLDDVGSDSPTEIVLNSVEENPERDTLKFFYENADSNDDPLYLDYTIQPVPVYPAHSGGAVL